MNIEGDRYTPSDETEHMSTQIYQLRDEGTQATIQIFGKLDVQTCGQLKADIESIVSQVPNRWSGIVVNLQGLDLIDSSGVAAIVGLYKRIRANGGQAHVTGAHGQPLQVFQILRMDKVFGWA